MTTASFKARSRILALLGEQLIGRDYLAVFELVKNSYDADASRVTVTLEDLDGDAPSIVVEDDGEGMDEEVLVGKWLEIGNDHREQQRRRGERTKRFKRLPLGEKGLGRIACHKLGHTIELTTRRARQPECAILIRWDDLIEEEYLDDTKIDIEVREDPEFFTGSSHGTRIRITDLKGGWERREVRSLNRAITSICSPFDGPADFAAELRVPGYEHLMEGMSSAIDLVQGAPWKFKFSLSPDLFEWTYEFSPPPGWGKRVSGRTLSNDMNEKLLLPHETGAKRVVHSPEVLLGIGPISGELYAYDKDPKLIKLYPEAQARNAFLSEQAGIRVYRSGMRVFNYGEPGDDWLNLDLRRVNRPTERLSRNIVVGAVNIDFTDDPSDDTQVSLREKTNREGFDENATYERFKGLVLAIIDKFERSRAEDKKRLKNAVEGVRETFERPVETPAADLRARIEKTEYADRFLPLLDKIENDYRDMKELLLRAGMSGINLAIVVHEVHRGMVALYEAIRNQADREDLIRQAQQLVHIFETIAGLLRQKGSRKADVREVVQTAANEVSKRRFVRHNVQVEFNLPELDPPFVVGGSFDLLLGALTNMIDNSLYWLRVRYPEIKPDEPALRKLFIGISQDLEGGRALVIADNGPGFSGDPELLAEPFVTGRPGGSGLGLYYASLAIQLSGGVLEFPDPSDLELPDWVDGAVIAMVFPEGKS